MLNRHRCSLGAALAALAVLPWTHPAQASEPVVPVLASEAAPAMKPADRLGLLGVRPVAAEVLATHRGGTLILNDMKLNGVVADNQASNLVTGNNTISEGAFSNAAGMPLVVQNSGNNVLIQNATIVNVQLK